MDMRESNTVQINPFPMETKTLPLFARYSYLCQHKQVRSIFNYIFSKAITSRTVYAGGFVSQRLCKLQQALERIMLTDLFLWFFHTHSSHASVIFGHSDHRNIYISTTHPTVSGISVTFTLFKLIAQYGVLKQHAVSLGKLLRRWKASYFPYLWSLCDWFRDLPLDGCNCLQPTVQTISLPGLRNSQWYFCALVASHSKQAWAK